jgi:hypothetical protein
MGPSESERTGAYQGTRERGPAHCPVAIIFEVNMTTGQELRADSP